MKYAKHDKVLSGVYLQFTDGSNRLVLKRNCLDQQVSTNPVRSEIADSLGRTPASKECDGCVCHPWPGHQHIHTCVSLLHGYMVTLYSYLTVVCTVLLSHCTTTDAKLFLKCLV